LFGYNQLAKIKRIKIDIEIIVNLSKVAF